MTCIEKLKEVHPNLYAEGLEYVAEVVCPDEFDIACEPEWCRGDNYIEAETMRGICERCWKREIEE